MLLLPVSGTSSENDSSNAGPRQSGLAMLTEWVFRQTPGGPPTGRFCLHAKRDADGDGQPSYPVVTDAKYPKKQKPRCRQRGFIKSLAGKDYSMIEATMPAPPADRACAPSAILSAVGKLTASSVVYYSMIEATMPAPTVRPPSRIAKRSFSSIAIGTISSTSTVTLSPGITISVPSGSETIPVTSVVRK